MSKTAKQFLGRTVFLVMAVAGFLAILLVATAPTAATTSPSDAGEIYVTD